MVLFQYSDDGGPVRLHHVWKHTARQTIDLMEETADCQVDDWNGVFDWYHVQKIHAMLSCLNMRELDECPKIGRMVEVERRAVFQRCIKPRAHRDLYLHATRGQYQTLMERRPVRIRRVPAIIAHELITILDERLVFDPIYFARKKEGQKWRIDETEDPDFVDLKLSFGASRTLKALHRHVFGSDPITLPLPKELMPVQERGAGPGKKGKDKMEWYPYSDGRPGTWPDFVKAQVEYWSTNEEALKYAADDVRMTNDLIEPLGDPEPNDTDSVLAAAVACVRYRGYAVDLEKAKEQYERSSVIAVSAGDLDWRPIKRKLRELCADEMERMGITSTKDEVLETLTKWRTDEGPEGSHPVAQFASSVRAAREARFTAGWLRKLLLVKRFHPAFNVHGSLTRRMAGGGGFNPQNVSKAPELRGVFTLKDTQETAIQYLGAICPTLEVREARRLTETLRKEVVKGFVLQGGDFEGFETALAIAAWKDETLEAIVKGGSKAYHVLGSYLYDDVLGDGDSDKAFIEIQRDCREGHPDIGGEHCKCNKIAYADRAKNCFYAYVYGAQELKVAQTAGVSIEKAAEALNRMAEKCIGMKAARQLIYDKLTCITQDREGGMFRWVDPQPLVENMLGYVRDFTQETEIIKVLFELSSSLPRDWQEIKKKVVRKDRQQTVSGATMSALFGSAKGIEARMKRQAGNCIMQSTGATICKEVQVELWTLQPIGVHEWLIQPMNVHDELESAAAPSVAPLTKGIVDSLVASYCELVPLIAMEWKPDIGSWAEK